MSIVGNATKPSEVSASIAPTDTVVRQQQQGITDAQPSVGTRAQNLFGISVTRGGQTLGIGFIDGVFTAYSNLSYQPLAMILAIVSFLYYLNKIIQGDSETGNNVYYTLTANIVKAGTSTESLGLKSIAWLLTAITSFIDKNGDFFTMVFSMWFPYFAKPSKRNGIISSVVTFIYLFMLKEYLSILAFSHCYFLFTQLRSPTHKMFVAIFAVVVCIIGHTMMYELVGMSKLTTSYTKPPAAGEQYGPLGPASQGGQNQNPGSPGNPGLPLPLKLQPASPGSGKLPSSGK